MSDLTKKIRNLHKKIRHYKNIYIMAHDDLDLDAIASCLAFSEIAKSLKKESYIVINEKNHEAGVKKILSNVKDTYNFINGKSARDKITKNDLLVLVDVSKSQITQDPDLCDYFKNVIVIDHHQKNDSSIDFIYEVIDNNTSSTSEILTKYLYFYDIIVPKQIATYLLSGIVLDTNNFTNKTYSLTFLSSHYLMEMGADNKEVQYLLKQDLEDYVLRQKVITDSLVFNKKIAVAVGSQKVKYKREELAKIADTLLEFNHIETSYVIGKLDEDTVGISARSIGKVNVGEMLEKLGGGGDKFEAAAKISDKSLKDVLEEVKKVIL